MKKVALLTVVTLLALGFASELLAYEGPTKLIASVNRPDSGESHEYGPVLLSSDREWMPTKPVQQFLHRFPMTTLSAQNIRQEMPGLSTGTKAGIRFQRDKKI